MATLAVFREGGGEGAWSFWDESYAIWGERERVEVVI